MVRNHSETDRAFDDKLSIKLKGIIKKKKKKKKKTLAKPLFVGGT